MGVKMKCKFCCWKTCGHDRPQTISACEDRFNTDGYSLVSAGKHLVYSICYQGRQDTLE